MERNDYTIEMMLHPDRYELNGAGDAINKVSQAYDTLSNVLKKTLFEQILSQTGRENDQPNQNSQEWESRQQLVKLPMWLRFLLSIQSCGYILFLILLLLSCYLSPCFSSSSTPCLLFLVCRYLISSAYFSLRKTPKRKNGSVERFQRRKRKLMTVCSLMFNNLQKDFK